MRRTAFLALLSHWLRSPLQLVTLLGGLALATALWSGVQAINAEARKSYERAASTVTEGDFAQIRGELTLADFVRLRRAGVLVSPVIEERLKGVRLIGLDILTAPASLFPQTESIQFTQPSVLIGRAESLRQIGEIEGVTKVEVQTAPPNTVLADISVVANLVGRGDRIDRLILLKDQPFDAPNPEALGFRVIQPQAGTDLAKLTDSFHLNLTAFGFLSFAVGIFIVNGAIGLAFEQRRPMIRTLRALGVPLRNLVFLMACELVVLSGAAGFLGVVLGYLVAGALLPDVAATLRGLYGADMNGSLSLAPMWWLGGILVSVGGALIASTGAFLKLWQMPLLATAQPRSWIGHGFGRLLRLGTVGLCVAVGVVAFVWGKSLISGFVLLGALLIGAALLLPSYLNAVLSLGQRLSRGPLVQWFWAESRTQVSGLSLALMALLLAMSANVGVSTMVSSFRITFEQFLDQRLAPELYVYADSVEQGAEIAAFVAPFVDAVLPLVYHDTVVSGTPVEIYGVKDHSTYPDNWRLLEGLDRPWVRVREGAILVNEQFARRTNHWTGDTVEIEGRAFLIAGVYGDYGNAVGQIVVAQPIFSGLYPYEKPLRFGLRLDPSKVEDVSKALLNFGLSADNVVNQSAIKDLSKSIFEQTFSVTEALNILTLAVAGFAILMSLLTLATMRLPGLAPVWALGQTRFALARLEVVRALLLAVITSIASIPLGLLLAWTLLAIVNVEAFGWKLPMFVFPLDYVWLTFEALLAAVFAALIPAIQLRKTPPSHLLKVFANER